MAGLVLRNGGAGFDDGVGWLDLMRGLRVDVALRIDEGAFDDEVGWVASKTEFRADRGMPPVTVGLTAGLRFVVGGAFSGGVFLSTTF